MWQPSRLASSTLACATSRPPATLPRQWATSQVRASKQRRYKNVVYLLTFFRLACRLPGCFWTRRASLHRKNNTLAFLLHFFIITKFSTISTCQASSNVGVDWQEVWPMPRRTGGRCCSWAGPARPGRTASGPSRSGRRWTPSGKDDI